ncbi:N-alpha-acetyltransferase 30 isoform X2 [Brachyistius frenatus]|uniref:N-alpha-acetyltransferase 30 isoform X2 n=1 Tax=Brachyistius frenatus TaxID=100188 RepID=UPI0037E9C9A2
MATVPPGPSSALPSSPAEIPPFPGAGSVEPAVEYGEPACRGEDRIPAGTGQDTQPVSDVKRSVKNKQKNMLARASPAALHLKMQAREQQQLNGLASPSDDPDGHQHAGSRSDSPRSSADNCDCSTEGAPAARNNSEHRQHEGHSPFTKNGRHSPLVNNSMNGVPGFTRTEAAHEGKNDYPQPPRPPSDQPPDAAGPGGEESRGDLQQQQQPPAAELARLDLSGSPGRAEEEESHGIRYVRYESELQMPWIMRLITKDLSEPYSIYTYRYFIHNWPQLCFLVVLETEITNKSALKLYENLGFVRDKRLFRYYLNGVDALRLKLWLR